ncbi:MAG: amino acid ABC transporter ATP-binding protein [Spirochaetaceae bacterium]|jgi:polar amino acid transport system ATP-binding protein|nr:amino acid ABC transporter ATP-binding protein [Spirochaetaceae bacterium]
MAKKLVVENLYKTFNTFEALNGVSMEAEEGDVIAVIGPSGSGKSTFLRCLNMLETPTSGRIFVNGVELTSPESNIDHERRKIGMVFQQFNLFPHLTVQRNIALAPVDLNLLHKQEAEARAMALLKRVGLADKANNYPRQLSGGQQQRVAIARALAMEPSLILFDEPTSALDPEMINEVLHVIRDLAHSGMTMIIVTHEMNFARDIANKVIVLENGVILEQGPPEQIFQAPREARTKQFLSLVIK